MRGGTSKALMFRRDALPEAREDWDALLLSAMGSPDPYGRQLNGMGGGLSSLSKVCVVGPPTRADADVDFTFAQVQISRALVDYSGNCGNMSTAIAPFALRAGLVSRPDGEATVLVHNTNTAKIIRAGFAVRDGAAVEEGDLVIPGVAGSGAPVRLDFLDPGGSSTGRLLPTGNPIDDLVTPRGTYAVSMVDAGNACAFAVAEDLGLDGTESPDRLEARPGVLETIAALRDTASVSMGLTASLDAARERPLTPFIAVVAPPRAYRTSDGREVGPDEYDVGVRFVSNGQPHRAIPGTGALAAAVASRVPGTVAAACAPAGEGRVRIGTPAGVVEMDARVEKHEGRYHAVSASAFRTFRWLFTGEVHA